MKKLFSIQPPAFISDTAILILRIGIGLLMLTHGLPKMEMLFSGYPVQFPPVLALSPELSLGLAVFAEVACSILIMAGIATRISVIPLIITMAIAAFYIHAGDGLAKQEPAIHYLLAYVILLFTGSGRFSMDYLFQRKTVKTQSYSRISIN